MYLFAGKPQYILPAKKIAYRSSNTTPDKLNDYKMPASKKTLRNQQQKKNQAAGIGDEKGRIASNVKEAPTMADCTICKQSIRMVKKNAQAAAHVESKHAGKKFEECFPGYTAN
jgi:hypothetical protein